MKSPTHRYRQHGFSLIEVLIAVVVLSLGLLALASLQSALIRSAADAKAQSLAMGVAKQKIEQLAAVQSLGGSDSNCRSPSAWDVTLGATVFSCYRMITDEGATAVDGDPILSGAQALGGINFTVATAVTRYVYNASTLQYGSVSDTALDSSLVTSLPETFLPGKEFKRIVVTVAWTDAAGTARSVQVEDALNGIVPRDSIALLLNRKGLAARKAESIVVDPGTIAGVIPIAMGNGSNTAASNPTPELLGNNNGTYVSETRFDVYSYIPLDGDKALAQSRVETAVVGCRCDTSTASTIETPLRPTYWDGIKYAIPTEANYVGLTGSALTANRPLAGPKALDGNELAQSDQCRVCCRDHHDPVGDDANRDSRSAMAFYSPRRVDSDGADVGTDPDPAHTHYLVDETTSNRTLVTTGAYSEVCRMIRVDGIFRVAADMNNDYFALLQARNSGASSFVPSSEVAEDYGAAVKKYLYDRVSGNSDATTYNNATSPADPYSVDYTVGQRTLSDNVTVRDYDLNAPSTYSMELSDDARWLHARGLYIDYMGPEAIARIELAKADCPTGVDLNECVLPYLPFTSINLSELAAWTDEAIIPDPADHDAIIKVMNNGFQTATGDSTFIETTGSGTAGELRIDFSSALDANITEGMAVSGTGIGDNARAMNITNGRRRLEVDVPNSATFSEGGDIVFQGAPVRGRVTPGTSPSESNASYARATATYNNAAIALKFSMNDEEAALITTSNTDTQRFDLSGGNVPDPSSSFTVSTFVNYPGNPAAQFKIAWGESDNTPSIADDCGLTSVNNVGVLPFVCSPSDGLGSGMSILLTGYNYMDSTQTSTTAIPDCTNSDGKALLAGGGPVTYSPALENPATSYAVKKCYNYEITSAANVTPDPDVVGQFNQSVVSPGLLVEATPIFFNSISANDDISVTFGAPTITQQPLTCTFTCSKDTCAANGNKKTYTVTSPTCP